MFVLQLVYSRVIILVLFTPFSQSIQQHFNINFYSGIFEQTQLSKRLHTPTTFPSLSWSLSYLHLFVSIYLCLYTISLSICICPIFISMSCLSLSFSRRPTSFSLYLSYHHFCLSPHLYLSLAFNSSPYLWFFVIFVRLNLYFYKYFIFTFILISFSLFLFLCTSTIPTLDAFKH